MNLFSWTLPSRKILAKRNHLLVVLLSLGMIFTPIVGKAQVGSAHFTVNTTADGVDANLGNGVCETALGNGECTLRAAIQESNTLLGTDSISLPGGTYTLTLSGAGEDASATGDLDITDHLNLKGAGAGVSIVEDSTGDRLFHIDPTGSGVEVIISALTVKGGSASFGAGLANTGGQLTLREAVVEDNVANASGGGIFSSQGSVLMYDVIVQNNQSTTASGGGLAFDNASVELHQVSVLNNTSILGGGIVTGGTSQLAAVDSLIQSNTAEQGGGIANGDLAVTTLIRTIVDQNQATGDVNSAGGGIINYGSTNLMETTLSNNTSSGEGGGFMNTTTGATAQSEGGEISGNSSGTEGGGIFNDGDQVDLQGTSLKGNQAADGGGIWSEAGLISLTEGLIEGNSSSGNGGGVYAGSGSVLNLTDSTVRGNTSGNHGGGLHITGADATLLRTTISGNDASFSGGGMEVYGTVTLQNVTLSGNSADFGGGMFTGSTITVINSTITDNTATSDGGGIYGTGTTDLKNSVLAGNNGTGSSTDCLSGGGDVISSGNNLVGIGDDCSGFVNGVNGDQVGSLAAPLDPMLDPLQDNGGLVETHALQSGSTAIDGGNNTGCPSIDARGKLRPYDSDLDGVGACEIGAFEIEVALTVNSTSDAVEDDPGDGICETAPGNGICTLRAAIQEANGHPGADTILLPSGTYTLNLAGANENQAATGDLDVTGPLALMGDGSGTTEIDGNGSVIGDRIFHLDPSGAGFVVRISGVTVSNGEAPTNQEGGGIYNNAVTLLTDVTVKGSFSDFFGGGIFNNNSLKIVDSTLLDNHGEDGGGIFAEGGSTTELIRTTVRGNLSNTSGGGINNNGDLSVRSSTFSGNDANTGKGGGIFNNVSTSVINSTLSGNTAPGDQGGGFYNGNTGALTNVTITENTASMGGGLRNDGTLQVGATIVANNSGGSCVNNSTINSIGYNLEDADTCGFNGPGDQTNTNPGLKPLADNGGPTLTHALHPASPAVDGVVLSLCLTADQRAVQRPFDGDQDGFLHCDVGAFEVDTLTLYLPIIISP